MREVQPGVCACTILLLSFVSFSSQEHGTSYKPLVIQKSNTFVRVLKELMISGRSYYLGLVKGDDNDNIHATVAPDELEEGDDSTKPGEEHVLTTADHYNAEWDRWTWVDVKVLGEIGLIPAYDVGFLKPYIAPNVVYVSRPGLHSPIIFNARQTWVNRAGTILQQ